MHARKLILVSALLLTLIAASAGFEDLQVEKEVSNSVNAGEDLNFETNFTSSADKALPLYVRVNVTSDEEIVGPEFKVEANLVSKNSDGSQETTMKCNPLLGPNYDYRPQKKKLIYSCFSDGPSAGQEVLPESQNHLNVTMEVHPATKPAEFSFKVEALEQIGSTDRKKTVRRAKTGSIELGNATVNFSSDEDLQVTSWKYSDIYTDKPGNREFIEGVDVLVSPSLSRVRQCPGTLGNIVVPLFDDYVDEGGYWFDRWECVKPSEEASGNVTFEFSEERNVSTVSIYRYDQENNDWNEVQGQEINAVENFAEADVDEFSVFALFGNKTSDDGTGGNGDKGIVNDPQNDEEPAAQSLGGTGSTTLNNDNVEVGETSDNSDNVDVSVDADFTYSQVEDSLQVDFDASSSTTEGVIESYSWDFGDDTSGTGETVSHEYSNGGLYPVNLTVETESGETDIATDIVEVEPLVEEDQLDSPVENRDGETSNEESSAPPATAQFASQPATAASLATLIFIIIFLAIYLRREIIHKIRSLSPF